MQQTSFTQEQFNTIMEIMPDSTTPQDLVWFFLQVCLAYELPETTVAEIALHMTTCELTSHERTH